MNWLNRWRLRTARLSRMAWLYFLIRICGRQTTKVCPRCFDERMVPLRSTNQKICPTCQYEVPWPLEYDQTPTLLPSRATRKGITK